MLAGSYGAGSVPLFMPMSEEKLHLVSVMGAGLLVGVAFAVIIPEGVLALIKAYTIQQSNHHLQQRSNVEEQPLSMENNGQVGRQLNEEHSDTHDDNSEHKYENLNETILHPP